MTETPITIVQQGLPRATDRAAIVPYGYGEGVVAIVVDLDSKRCDVQNDDFGEDGAPRVWIRATDISLHLTEYATNKYTIISFPEFAGWTVWLADISRYTLRVCLVKGKS